MQSIKKAIIFQEGKGIDRPCWNVLFHLYSIWLDQILNLTDLGFFLFLFFFKQSGTSIIGAVYPPLHQKIDFPTLIIQSFQKFFQSERINIFDCIQ